MRATIRFLNLMTAIAFCNPAFACGPFFPMDFLVHGGRDILAMPETIFRLECLRILNLQEQAEEELITSELDLWNDSVRADIDEFALAVHNQPDAAALIAEYTQMREALDDHIREWLQARQDARESYDPDIPTAPATPFDLQPFTALLEKLPPEFAEYFRGAAAYHNADYAGAIPHFEAVLALPEPERHFKSTWAAFMLGKSWTQEEPARAGQYFEQVRILAEQGYRDPLGLAPESLGWQARAELSAGAFLEAIHHYADCAKDPVSALMARLSLETACRQALAATPILENVAADELCRNIVTAWLLSHRGAEREAQDWVEALEKAGIEATSGADRLAWVAYNTGDMEAAARWLAHADSSSPFGKWVQAKLLYRDGKYAEAEALLEEVTTSFGTSDYDLNDQDWFYAEDPAAASDLANDDRGFVQLKQQAYARALSSFMKGKNWSDPALIAERILTLQELRDYVDTMQDSDEPDPNLLFSRPDSLRNLLARRLARAGLWDAAITYYRGGEFARLAQTHRDHLNSSGDQTLSPHDRARHLFEAGQLLRESGMELVGTELSPDEYPDGSYP
ncbi:MAG: hypothetical protein HYV26_23525, partial [Candidatus Hydrogenedentes bacterium]|nr:hypothetical protein [Candidatus Hydrogenedentota bacterium]